MLTRSQSLSGTVGMDASTRGKSLIPNMFDNTIVSRPGLYSSPIGPGTSDGMSDSHCMLVPPVSGSSVAPPSDQKEDHGVKTETNAMTAKDLEILQRELNVKAKEIELAQLKLEFERMTFQQVQVGGTSLPGQYAYGGMQQITSHSQGGVTLPRIEIESYDGSPQTYWSFKRSFEVNIAKRVQDPEMRFSYLQYYCRGKARVAIKGCAILDPSIAYSEAWKIIEKQFGKPHKIVNCILKDLLEGGPVDDNLEDMETLVRNMRECLIALTQMGKRHDLDYEPRLLKLTDRLPRYLRVKWAKRAGIILGKGREPAFEDVIDFVEERISAMDNAYGMAISEANRSHRPRPTVNHQQQSRVSTIVTSTIPSCGWCSRRGHGLGGCKAFAEASLQDRRDFIRKSKRCFVCLNSGHLANDCKSNVRCTIAQCSGKHHTLLHASQIIEADLDKTNANVITGGVRLGFIPVVLKGSNREVVTNALVDNGSDVTLISEKLANQLQLKGDRKTLNIRTLHGTQPTSSRCVTLQLGSIDGEYEVTASNVFTIDRLPCSRVDKLVDLGRWSHLRDVKVESISHDEIGLLLGCDVPEAHWVLDQRIGKPDEPHAVQTPFGWTVRGNMNGQSSSVSQVNFTSIEVPTLEESLERLYEREFRWSTDDDAEAPSREDRRALEIVERTTKLVEGRYEVGVPWKRPNPRLPDNRDMAIRRVNLLRNRLMRNKELLVRYRSTLDAHIQKNYVSEVDTVEVGKRWYLPHHPVLNPKKPDKLRIVFDCAAKYQNVSLNDELLSGPNLNNDLAGVLLRFREGLVATSADIEEMFLRVRLPVCDRWAFSFLWWTNDELLGEPCVFQWNVHPFGASSSPFCAAYALRRTALDNSLSLFEPCREAVNDNFYVDDCLLASSSVEAAAVISVQLRDMLSEGGFKLTKWVSNVVESLGAISNCDRLPGMECKKISDKESHSTLGLLWDTKEDSLRVNLRIDSNPTTKRGVLACIASFFDPLGIISPLLLPARKFLQKLCTQGLGWDSELDTRDQRWWTEWSSNMVHAPVLAIERNLTPPNSFPVSMRLHVFSDASNTGYGAVAYLRQEDSLGNVSVHFIMGKARVVPSKPITIPRLELTAAVLATKLMKFVSSQTRLELATPILWTDSQIVLHYIRNVASRYKTFVANRIGYILENSKVDQWKHVPTAVNPADLASRGMTKVTPTEIDLWLNGPSFLRLNTECWPQSRLEVNDLSRDDEVKRVTVLVTNEQSLVLSKLLLRYSTWSSLIKGTAWLKRFVQYFVLMKAADLGQGLSIGRLKLVELELAEMSLVRMIQRERFENELVTMLSGKKAILKTSIARLKPIIHDELLCLGGRVSNRLVILPYQHQAVDMLIEHYHQICGHMGACHVLSSIRRKYWIVKGMASVRRVLSKCMVCKMATARPCGQVLAPLPPLRTFEGLSPFMECGVDYFGPFEVKMGRSLHKRYGCLFTCMKTRAVHLEVAHSMSTDAFLMALIRFIGRRGVPQNLYSDNGSNFVGAETQLRQQVDNLNQRHIVTMATDRGFVWHFNPPYASHRGGIWERMIRTTRRVLTAVANHQRLTDESLLTYMVETERLINDRPIAPIYDDPENPVALRPNDLLLLRPNGGMPFTEVNLLERYTKEWKQAHYLASVFWKRWVKEYLPTLQVVNRWSTVQRDLKKGDLVLLLGGTTTYGQWPKGVVEEAISGLDGHVRDVKIRTSTGVVTRDIRSVCLLEAAFDESH